jgi:uncharacterized protein YdeI (BOF family)
MHDNWLVASAMIISSVGIAGLLFALIVLAPQSYSFYETKALPDSAPVRVNGTVVAVREIGNRTLLTITQPSTIDIVVDDKAALHSSISTHDCIIIDGKKERYNGNVQIIPSKISSC